MERDIVERLRDPTYAGPMQHLRSWSEIDQICNSAADLIESLRSELDEARKALESEIRLRHGMAAILRQQADRPIGIKPGRNAGRDALAKESGEARE